MITSYNLFEFYTGPYKAAGFKHFNDEGFAFIIDTTEEGIENFFLVEDDFFNNFIDSLGFDQFTLNIDNTTIFLIFKAINQYEAMSIIGELKNYFDENEIPIDRASMRTGITKDTKQEEFFTQNLTDITDYINRKEIIKKIYGVEPKSDSYKKTKIGF